VSDLYGWTMTDDIERCDGCDREAGSAPDVCLGCAITQIEKLKIALRKYGKHLYKCDLVGWQFVQPPSHDCTCGLNEIAGIKVPVA
jgi:hypothetical protein